MKTIEMKSFICSLLGGCCLAISLQAQNMSSITSPDGSITMRLDVEAGKLFYEVQKSGMPVLLKAPIRMSLDGEELCQSAVIQSSDVYQTDQHYPIRGSHSEAWDRGNGMKISMKTRILVWTLSWKPEHTTMV